MLFCDLLLCVLMWLGLKVDSADAEKSWTEQYDSSVNTCSHAYWRGNCRNATAGHECEVGKFEFNCKGVSVY